MKSILTPLLGLMAALALQGAQIVEVSSDGLKEPFGTEFDSKGTMYVVEMVSGNRLFRVEEGGKLVHVAGQEKPGYSGDGGPALQAQFNGPHNLAVLPDGDVLIGDTWNGVVRKVDLKKAVVTTLSKAPVLTASRSISPGQSFSSRICSAFTPWTSPAGR
jgi:glucose/arabinose dehydrogenase